MFFFVYSVNVGVGNGHKRSKRFEAFVMEEREKLKQERHLCEAAVQRILCYSNNFLHKKLKCDEVLIYVNNNKKK
jgi:hypothetical protein